MTEIKKTVTTMDDVQNYIKDNQKKFLGQLFELIKIKSITSGNDHSINVMRKCAEKLKTTLTEAGANKAELIEIDEKTPPLVYAERIINEKYPTVLVYGHYDVMPVAPLDEWHTPKNPETGEIDPFYPVIMENLSSEVVDISDLSDEVIEKCRIWARGADDDKGQSFMQIAAFEAMCKQGYLDAIGCNVKFILEGQEEIGSAGLTHWCNLERERMEQEKISSKIKSDVIIVSDTSLLGMNTPSLTCGLRGLAYVQVKVTGPNRDLHSGLFGGAVANPINVLCKMIGSLIDENGRITIPGFYDWVFEHSFEDRDKINSAPFDERKFAEGIGCNSLTGEVGYTTLERKGIRPTLDVCGIWGGYIEEGTKTVLPSTAQAKISMRLVEGQDYKDISEKIKRHLIAIAPPTVKVEVDIAHGGHHYCANTSSVAYKAAEKALEENFNSDRTIPYYSGGSIPIISALEKVAEAPAILMGFGLDSDAIHSPNENYPLKNFFLGIQTIPCFYRNFINDYIAD